MKESITEFTLKLILLGECNVGKSQLLLRFTKDYFKTDSKSTEGLEYGKRIFPINNLSVRVQVWDCAGSSQPEKLTKYFYKNAVGALLIYDVTNRESYNAIEKVWTKQIKAFGREEMQCILIGNKCEVASSAVQVTKEDGERLADKIGCAFIETSARSGNNVDEAFRYLTYSLARNVDEINTAIIQSHLPEGWVITSNSSSSGTDKNNDNNNDNNGNNNNSNSGMHSSLSSSPSEPVEYENFYTGKKTTRKPGDSDAATSTVNNANNSNVVRLPSNSVDRSESKTKLVSRASISMARTMSEPRPTDNDQSFFKHLPTCCIIS